MDNRQRVFSFERLQVTTRYMARLIVDLISLAIESVQI
jgi:hypothetical protein